MPGLASYKKWMQEEVSERVAFLSKLGAQQLGVFTLAEQDKYPEDYWWPILEGYINGTI